MKATNSEDLITTAQVSLCGRGLRCDVKTQRPSAVLLSLEISIGGVGSKVEVHVEFRTVTTGSFSKESYLNSKKTHGISAARSIVVPSGSRLQKYGIIIRHLGHPKQDGNFDHLHNFKI